MTPRDVIVRRNARRLFTVPYGTPTKQCSCGVRLYMIATEKGNRMPIRCDVPDGCEPTATAPGLGAAHWADCPNATNYRRPKPAGGTR